MYANAECGEAGKMVTMVVMKRARAQDNKETGLNAVLGALIQRVHLAMTKDNDVLPPS